MWDINTPTDIPLTRREEEMRAVTEALQDDDADALIATLKSAETPWNELVQSSSGNLLTYAAQQQAWECVVAVRRHYPELRADIPDRQKKTAVSYAIDYEQPEVLAGFIRDGRADLNEDMLFGNPLKQIINLPDSKEKTRFFELALCSGVDPDKPFRAEGLVSPRSVKKKLVDTSLRRLIDASGSPDLQDVLERYDSLPEIDKPVSAKEDLFRPRRRADGQSYLDHPATWQQIDTLQAQIVEAGGEPLSLQDLFEVNKSGKSWLEVAADAGCLHKALAVTEAFEQFDHSLLLTEKGKPHPVAGMLIDAGLAEQLFDADKWRGENAGVLRRLLQELPECQRDAIPNRHVLQADVSQKAQSIQQGIGG